MENLFPWIKLFAPPVFSFIAVLVGHAVLDRRRGDPLVLHLYEMQFKACLDLAQATEALYTAIVNSLYEQDAPSGIAEARANYVRLTSSVASILPKEVGKAMLAFSDTWLEMPQPTGLDAKERLAVVRKLAKALTDLQSAIRLALRVERGAKQVDTITAVRPLFDLKKFGKRSRPSTGRSLGWGSTSGSDLDLTWVCSPPILETSASQSWSASWRSSSRRTAS